MGALQAAQWRYDNAEPEDDSDYRDAIQAWVERRSEELLRGSDIVVKRFGRVVGRVDFADFLQALDEHANSRLQGFGVSPHAFGGLVWAALCSPKEGSGYAENLLGEADPRRALLEIADRLLEPLAAEGLLADAEDAD
ncbi:hypothetical protein [Pseudomonas putida]|uniref:Uncharacterized protein n=1 Tax=Pseudomonas putida TaxID=303 RepID=A0A177SD42_PSEPU|nr:hypothetical protein [Pseudomonas putida]OAI84910.1 hypothetical protein AYO28_03235 [Pseudomonas putida]